jgi:hypothetical protein
MALRLLLVSFRHNLTQRLLAVMFRVSQSTVCRALRWMRSILAEVLADEIAAAGDAGAALERILGQAAGRPVVLLLDGTLIPTADRFYDPLNYSGKHGRIGRNLQVVADVGGRLLCAGPPQAGRLHDRGGPGRERIRAASQVKHSPVGSRRPGLPGHRFHRPCDTTPPWPAVAGPIGREP